MCKFHRAESEVQRKNKEGVTAMERRSSTLGGTFQKRTHVPGKGATYEKRDGTETD